MMSTQTKTEQFKPDEPIIDDIGVDTGAEDLLKEIDAQVATKIGSAALFEEIDLDEDMLEATQMSSEEEE